MQHTLTSNRGFYIGDICYVLSRKVYDEIWGNQHAYQEGKIQVGDQAFVVDRTAHGDGTFADNNGRKYSVDAGVIGCVPFELVDMDKIHESYDPGADPIDILNDLGLFIEGSRAEFETDDEGLFTITVDNQITVIIDTNYPAGYEEEDEDSGEHYESDEDYDDSDDEEYFEEYDGDEETAEEFLEYNGLEPGDEYIEEVQYSPDSNVARVLAQARDNPAMFQIHSHGEVASDGVTVKFIYYANPRKPLDGTYIDIDSTNKGFETFFKGHVSSYLSEEEISRIILNQLQSYLSAKSGQQEVAKESVTKTGSGTVRGEIEVKDFEFEYDGYKFIADVKAYADIYVYISVKVWKSYSYYEQDSSETTIEEWEIRDITDLSAIDEIRIYSLDNPTVEIPMSDEIEELINTEGFDNFLLSKLNDADVDKFSLVDEDDLDTSNISV